MLDNYFNNDDHKKRWQSVFVFDACKKLAETIPCELCRLKGGANINDNGSCRHNPIYGYGEIINRLTYAVNCLNTKTV